jgi:hypothetical protein
LFAACLVLAQAAVAQGTGKLATPLPWINLDDKAAAPVGGPFATTPPKSDAPVALRSARAEPRKGKVPGALVNGHRFGLGLPREVVFDVVDGTVWADGSNYKASFAADGFTYVPFFGSDAARNYPIVFSLQAAAVGAAAALGAAAPQLRGNTVTIERGALRERYDVHSGHVEQKFEIATPFRGDLTLTLGGHRPARGTRRRRAALRQRARVRQLFERRAGSHTRASRRATTTSSCVPIATAARPHRWATRMASSGVGAEVPEPRTASAGRASRSPPARSPPPARPSAST